jgi:hypothetical protein
VRADAPAPENAVLGIVRQGTFPEPQLLEETIRRGMMRHPGALWVTNERDKETIALFEKFGLEYVTLGLHPFWKVEKDDHRQAWRRHTFLLCDELLVFQPTGSASEWTRLLKDKVKYGIHGQLHVIERGKPKPKKRRKGRKPVDV